MATLGSDKDRQALTLRLKRIEGQLRGIQKMIEDDADCERIAQQLSAARKGLDRTFYELVACTLEHELGLDVGKKSQMRARIGQAAALLAKFA